MTAVDNSASWTFAYNADGLRIRRSNGSRTYGYTYLGGQLTHMTADGHTLYFTYDASGTPLTLTYDGLKFYYITNLQGDVIAIIDGNGTEFARYTYDAWGNILSVEGSATNLRYYNPLRYRGYVYDPETGLYYLQSRYYNSEVGRFLNADGFVSTGQDILGYNLFVYCGNNPVNRTDPSGQFWLAALIFTAVAAVCTVTLSGCSTQPTSGVGAAPPYTPSSSTQYNCYAHALGETQWKYVGGSQNAVKDYSVENVAEMVLSDAKKDGRSIRIISSHDAPIQHNEYSIALRTGVNDYHFMIKHNDGSWSHKPGYCRTRLIDGANPSVISWDLPQVDRFLLESYGIIKKVGSIPNYYDSETVYFAVCK